VLLEKEAAMPVVALALFAIFGLLGFGWRSWLQYRRTGSTGFRGVSGRVGSTEWFAGAGFVVAMAAAFFAPVLQMTGIPPRRQPLSDKASSGWFAIRSSRR
jgi:uncharacterized membrane protein YedE/YeeE